MFNNPFNDRRFVEIKCHCGEYLTCNLFTNACDCGRDYSVSGKLLPNRSQWGAETGESLSDILAADTNPFGSDE